MGIILTRCSKITTMRHFLLKALPGCLIYNVQHIINKLDFCLLVNLNIISKLSKDRRPLPKTGRGKFEQLQIRIQAVTA